MEEAQIHDEFNRTRRAETVGTRRGLDPRLLRVLLREGQALPPSLAASFGASFGASSGASFGAAGSTSPGSGGESSVDESLGDESDWSPRSEASALTQYSTSP